MQTAAQAKVKPYRGLAMEGPIASWYARNTAGSLPDQRALAKRIAAQLRPDSALLEIAPGPGYLAIELARLGTCRVTGLDISRSFVRIAAANARRAGVEVDWRHGDAAAQPFAAGSFDFLVCRAAFKNFGDPVGALREMHRVLRPGGTALIVDMRADASSVAIAAAVAEMGLRGFGAMFTRMALWSLKKRAYSREAFDRMLAQTPFGQGEINAADLGFEVWLRKAPAIS
jgi:ubiquinone/menaquinone biosynthesis C-methylase UbiE